VSSLLGRIMLALLMLPLGGVVYAVSLMVMIEYMFGYSGDETAFLLADMLAAAFVAVYWILLWRRTVQWTQRRIGLTIVAALAALAGGAMIGAIGGSVNDSFGIFIGGVATIFLWLTATVFAWRETGEERIMRVRATGAGAVACPQCGYNMTGLAQSACPECGATFTLDEFLAGQRSRQMAEFEQTAAAAPNDQCAPAPGPPETAPEEEAARDASGRG